MRSPEQLLSMRLGMRLRPKTGLAHVPTVLEVLAIELCHQGGFCILVVRTFHVDSWREVHIAE